MSSFPWTKFDIKKFTCGYKCILFMYIYITNYMFLDMFLDVKNERSWLFQA